MTLVIIPARYGSKRLPGKPLERIGRASVVQHCFLRACEAELSPIVATDDERIARLFPASGAVMTGDHPSGTDRVAEAAELIDPEGKHEYVINYQGDMPFLEAETLREFVRQREQSSIDILTAYTTLNYVSSTLWQRKSVNCHIGLYGYTRKALRQFASLPPSDEELSERLEQLRVVHTMSTMLVYVHHMPLEINTRDDLAYARQIARCTS